MRSDGGSSIEQALAEIACDRSRGAAELATRGVELLAAIAEAEACAGRLVLPPVWAVARRLRDVRPSMVALGNWAAAFVTSLEGRGSEGAPWTAALEAMAEERAAIAAGQLATAKAAFADIDAVLTLSYSSTIVRLLSAPEAPRRVVVAESRPLFEGRKLVEALHASGREVVCIADAAIPYFVARVSAVLLGVDTVCRDAAAVNKVGSLSAALAARHAGVPLFVAADRFKLDPRRSSAEIVLEEMAGEELWPERASLCRNPYFEVVPAGLITAFITESGVHVPAALSALFATIEALQRRLDAP